MPNWCPEIATEPDYDAAMRHWVNGEERKMRGLLPLLRRSKLEAEAEEESHLVVAVAPVGA